MHKGEYPMTNSPILIFPCNRYAISVGAHHFHTSAKTNKGLDDVFNNLAERILLSKSSKDQAECESKQKLVILEDTISNTKKRNSCC